MTYSNDAFIEDCRRLAIQVRKLSKTLSDCAEKSINGQYLFRPAYAEEFRNLARQAREDERLVLECAKYLGGIIARAQKQDYDGTPMFSQAQLMEMIGFLEMAKKPLYPALKDAEYVHPGLNMRISRDC